MEYEEVTYEPPNVILKKLRDLEDWIRQDLGALEKGSGIQVMIFCCVG